MLCSYDTVLFKPYLQKLVKGKLTIKHENSAFCYFFCNHNYRKTFLVELMEHDVALGSSGILHKRNVYVNIRT